MRKKNLFLLLTLLVFISCKKDKNFEGNQALQTLYKGQLGDYDVYQNHNVLLKIPASNGIGDALSITENPDNCVDEIGGVLFPKCDFWEISGQRDYTFSGKAILEITIDKSWLNMYDSNNNPITFDFRKLKIYRYYFDYDLELWQVEPLKNCIARKNGNYYTISGDVSSTGYFTVGVDKLDTNYPFGFCSFELSKYNPLEFNSNNALIYPFIIPLKGTVRSIYGMDSEDGINNLTLLIENPEQYETATKYHIESNANDLFGWKKNGVLYTTRVQLGYDITFNELNEKKIDATIDAILVNVDIKDTIHAKGRFYIQN